MGVVLACGILHVAFDGSDGMMTTARPELPYPRISQAKFLGKLLGGESNATFMEHRDYANEAYHFLVNGRMVVYK